MGFIYSDEFLAIVVFWVCAGIYSMLGSLDKYRLHSRKDEDTKNLVSKSEVVRMVLLQQLFQVFTAFLWFMVKRDDRTVATCVQTSKITLAIQFFVAMSAYDTWQYFWHRYMHCNKFLYRHIHSWHHRLIVPYSFGSQYNHPLEALVDIVGTGVAFVLSGMSPRTSIFFFSLTTIIGMDQHCGLWFLGNVFHVLFLNNTAYHDVHHQFYGNKYNFSHAFFIVWDKILGTHMPYTVERRIDGGLEARPTIR